jgi:hypothetical protein
MKMTLYKNLITRFHPDVCKLPYALERAKLININKNNVNQLLVLARRWGVLELVQPGDYTRREFTGSVRSAERVYRPVTRHEQVRDAFVRCGLRPHCDYSRTGVTVVINTNDYEGIMKVNRTSGEFVFYIKDGKLRRTSILKCRK